MNLTSGIEIYPSYLRYRLESNLNLTKFDLGLPTKRPVYIDRKSLKTENCLNLEKRRTQLY